MVLTLLDTATKANQLDLPGFRFHRLHGDLVGYYSVRVTGSWRIIFRFSGVPEEVYLVDDH